MGNQILMDMLNEASGGDNPGPAEGIITRPINQEDVLVMAARLVAKKKLAQGPTKPRMLLKM